MWHSSYSPRAHPQLVTIAMKFLALPYADIRCIGSIFQIGWAYAIGIALAIITCAPTSGGHFNPAITLCLAVWQGFPWKKVPYYIFAQIFGAFMAGMILMAQYYPEMTALAAEMTYVPAIPSKNWVFQNF